jgi:hypothetical protein
MNKSDDTDPLGGPIDDEPDESTAKEDSADDSEKESSADDSKKSAVSDWMPEPRPAEGDGPLP